MLHRYLTAIPPGILITMGLLFAMQALIASGKSAAPPDNRGFPLSLTFVRPVKEERVDVIVPPERIDPPVEPPLQRSPQHTFEPGPGIGISGLARKPAPPKDIGLTGILTSDGPLVHMVRVRPTYPPAAARNGLEGYVTVRFDVGADGMASNVQVIDATDRIFESAAIRAAKKFRFKAKVVDGRPVSVAGVTYRFRFELED